jgi:hypothetical protein
MSTEATTSETGVEVSEESSQEESTEASEASEESYDEASEQEGSDEGAEQEQEEVEQGDSDGSTFEVTVDGQKLQLTREELMQGFQLGAASHKRFQEAARLKREAESTLNKLKENPIEAFIAAGGDEAAFRSLAEQFLYDKISYEKMSPEEQELADLRRYKEQQEASRQTEAQRKQQEALEKEASMHQETFAKEFTSALESAGIPTSEKAIAAVAQIKLTALEEGYDLPTELAVQQYQKEQSELINNYLGSLDADRLVGVIGKDRMKEIRKRELASLKNPTPRARSKGQSAQEPQKKISAKDFFDSLG